MKSIIFVKCILSSSVKKLFFWKLFTDDMMVLQILTIKNRLMIIDADVDNCLYLNTALKIILR